MSGMLAGKTAVVTGGEGGIGQAICDRFAREGAQVVSADLAQRRESTERIRFHQYDVTCEEQAGALFDSLAADWGHLDILVNAAGIEIEKTIEET